MPAVVCRRAHSRPFAGWPFASVPSKLAPQGPLLVPVAVVGVPPELAAPAVAALVAIAAPALFAPAPLRVLPDIALAPVPAAAAAASSAMTGIGVPVARAIGSSSPRRPCRALAGAAS